MSLNEARTAKVGQIAHSTESMLICRLWSPQVKAALAILIGLGILFYAHACTAGVVTSNVLQRTFAIRVGQQLGTCFTIEVENRQYVITAKHIFKGTSGLRTVDILHDKTWVPVPFQFVEVEPNSVDIAVLALNQQLSPLWPIQLGTKDTYLSQELYFVGFPFGLSFDGKMVNSGYPIPLVKHGILASFANGKGEPLIIDGINNPGFSGGPVTLGESPTNPTVIGVVSGVLEESKPIRSNNDAINLYTQTNTGLMQAFSIDYAIEAIKKNPIGVPVNNYP